MCRKPGPYDDREPPIRSLEDTCDALEAPTASLADVVEENIADAEDAEEALGAAKTALNGSSTTLGSIFGRFRLPLIPRRVERVVFWRTVDGREGSEARRRGQKEEGS